MSESELKLKLDRIEMEVRSKMVRLSECQVVKEGQGLVTLISMSDSISNLIANSIFKLRSTI